MPPVREALSRIMVLKLPKVQNAKVQVAPAVQDGIYQGFQDVTSQPMGTVYWKPGAPDSCHGSLSQLDCIITESLFTFLFCSSNDGNVYILRSVFKMV